jgi:C2H2 transcription facotor
MTAFQSVNIGLPLKEYPNDATTPTTPRAPVSASSQTVSMPITQASAPTTPTRLNFGGTDGQRPLPSASFSTSFSSEPSTPHQAEPGKLNRGSSHQSTRSNDSQDIDMDDDDDEEANSDAESVDGETDRPSKKKKGLRFFCTDYPPCNLSFTRSEHLARHIRWVPIFVP